MTTLDTLKLIAGRSTDALHEALGAIRAQQTGSPMAARRAERTARLALTDPQANWTPEERQQIAALLGGGAEPARTLDIRIRVNADEKQQVQDDAAAAGLTVAAYMRQRLGLPGVE